MLYIFRPLRTRHEDLICSDANLTGDVNVQAVSAALKMVDMRRGHVAELATAGLHHVESQLVRGRRRVPEHETLLLTTWMIAAEADVKTIMSYMPYLAALYHLARSRYAPISRAHTHAVLSHADAGGAVPACVHAHTGSDPI